MCSYWMQSGGFGNEYGLVYCTSSIDEEKAQAQGYERITREEAVAKCIEERKRRKGNPAFSGYAPCYIYPYMDDYYYVDFDNYPWSKLYYRVVKAG